MEAVVITATLLSSFLCAVALQKAALAGLLRMMGLDRRERQ